MTEIESLKARVAALEQTIQTLLTPSPDAEARAKKAARQARWRANKALKASTETPTETPTKRLLAPTNIDKASTRKATGLTVENLTDRGLRPQVAADLLAHRRAIKAPLTATALEGIEREAAKAGICLNTAVLTMLNRGWRGFNASWVKPGDLPNQQSAESAFLKRLRGSDGAF